MRTRFEGKIKAPTPAPRRSRRSAAPAWPPTRAPSQRRPRSRSSAHNAQPAERSAWLHQAAAARTEPHRRLARPAVPPSPRDARRKAVTERDGDDGPSMKPEHRSQSSPLRSDPLRHPANAAGRSVLPAPQGAEERPHRHCEKYQNFYQLLPSRQLHKKPPRSKITASMNRWGRHSAYAGLASGKLICDEFGVCSHRSISSFRLGSCPVGRERGRQAA